MSKKKFYVVWKGHKTGIFNNWSETETQIKGFSGALYQGYKTENEAIAAFNAGSPESHKNSSSPSTAGKPTHECLTVDGAFSSSSKLMEYRCVMNVSGKVIFYSKPFIGGSNNIAEFLALVGALRYRDSINTPEMEIYSDSKTALAWVRNKQINTTIEIESLDPVIQGRIKAAIEYLNSIGEPKNLKKWHSSQWGEIPSDYGRK